MRDPLTNNPDSQPSLRSGLRGLSPWEPPPAAPPEPPPPVQFGLRGLLWLQAVCAVFFAGLLLIGAFAVLAAFIATLVFAAIQVATQNRPLKRLIIELMGGIILPCLCLYFDPGILRVVNVDSSRTNAIRPNCLILDLGLGFQMAALAAWLAIGRRAGHGQAVFAGILTVGVLAAGTIGTALVPYSLFGIAVAGYGFLGLTPILTLVVFASNASQAWELAKRRGNWLRYAALLLGVAIALAVPVALYFSVGPYAVELFRRLPPPQFPSLLR